MKRILCILLMLSLLPFTPVLAQHDGLQMLAINVGKADCILLQSGTTRYLIDTGTADSWGRVSAVLSNLGITHLNGVIVTHTDSDHAGGAAALAQSSLTIDAWYAPAYHVCKTKKHPLVKAAAIRGENVTWLNAGDTLPIDNAALTVLAPVVASQTENCNSLVLLAESSDGSILLTGDMEFEEEATILSSLPQVTVLKVANHGEADATSQDLVLKTRPALAVISTDSSVERDTPSGRVLSVLSRINCPMYCTQNARTGILVTMTDGVPQAVSVNDELPPTPPAVVISDKSVAQDTVSITNWSSDTVPLDGWYIISDRGNELFLFPQDCVIQPGGTITIGSGVTEAPADFLWQDKRVWHAEKNDTARLYDAYGQLVCKLD